VNDSSDPQLLRAYVEHRSEAAFAELVRRHVDFVYSAALRMVCDSHLAQDVAQGVFVALARNAAQLTGRPVLSGWLHRTAQNIAAQTVRTDVRRRARESEAATMNELLSVEPEAGWEDIAPQLDTALGELSEPERDALFLRYFERKSAREMAQTLGVSEEAAQKRVNRAVERLRELFAQRKVTIGASGLAVLISANAMQAAPAGLATTISAAALLTGTAVSATVIATTKTIAMTTLQKTLVTATVAVLAGAGIYEARQASQLRDQVQTLQQQQAPLADQVPKLQTKRDESANKTVALVEGGSRPDHRVSESVKSLEPSRVRPSAPLIHHRSGKQSNNVEQTFPLQKYPESSTNPTNHIPEVLTYPEALREIAAKRFTDATNALMNATSDSDRYLHLSEAAKFAFLFGKTEDARKYATELLALDQRFLSEPWRGGDAVFYGNLVLGRVAVQEGRIDEAKQYLLESGHTIGSPVLGSFGPDMTLAKDLLQHGERDTVIQFFELCENFWKTDLDSLQNWKLAVQSGTMPDFGGRLY